MGFAPLVFDRTPSVGRLAFRAILRGRVAGERGDRPPTFEAWQRDDLETWLSYIHEDIEYHAALERAVQGAGGAYVGHEGMLRLWNVWRTEVEDLTIESLELREAPDGRVVHRTHARWRGAASGIEVESPLVLVLTVRDGKVVRSVDYLSHEEALEAVGPRE
jgi:ketosteroid isomerase-like protein